MKNRWLIFISLLLLLSVVSIGCPTDTNNNGASNGDDSQVLEDIPANFLTYTDSADYYSISYPPDWEPFPSSSESIPMNKDFFKVYNSEVILRGLAFIFIAESDVSNASVNIVVQALSEMTSKGWLTLDEIVEGKLQRQEEISYEYHEYSRTNTTVDGINAVIIDWETSYTDSDKKVRSVQMFIIIDQLVWKITCYVDSEIYDNTKDDLYDIVKSLRILQ